MPKHPKWVQTYELNKACLKTDHFMVAVTPIKKDPSARSTPHAKTPTKQKRVSLTENRPKKRKKLVFDDTNDEISDN